MDYIRKISLDLNLISERTVVNVKQNDVMTRIVNINITRDGEHEELPDDTTGIQLRCLRDDGHRFIYSYPPEGENSENSLISINNDSTLNVVLDEELLEKSGDIFCDVFIEEDGKGISTSPFLIKVLPSPKII